MAPVLQGLRVVDLSWGIAGPVTTMLLGDYGAEVIKVEPPGGDPFRAMAGYTVWNRGKKSVVLDLEQPSDLADLRSLAATADIVIESFSPGTTTRLGIDHATLAADNPGLVYCSITGYGRHGAAADRPGYDGLVQARWGLQNEQPGLRPGPVFLHAPLPSYGAALLASMGIHAALLAREHTGRGQWVETSLAQGTLVWMSQIWKRAESPTPALTDLWRFKDFPPTPCFEASDGLWFHPMPQSVPAALAHVGQPLDALGPMMVATGEYEERKAFFDGVRQLFLQRPRDEWVKVVQDADVPCQPVGRAEDAFDHPQIVNNRASTVVELPDVGPVKQLGRPYHLERHEEPVPAPPPAVGQHTEEVRASLASTPPKTATAADGSTRRFPLDGIRVLDFGTALAGPFGPMIMSDLGADVIKVDPMGPMVGTPMEATYAACQRGKRSIAIDLKSPEGQKIAHDLIASADVLHYNLRTGVAERLGYGYEQCKAINPRLVHCHVTSYGNTGPLARYPGVDQMGQALCGLEWEQGATDNGGHPMWYRFGMCDATTGMLSVIGVLQALRERDRTGEGQWVEANIINAALFLSSDAFVGPESLPTRPHLDGAQMGLGALYRLYETSEGWLCVAAIDDDSWRTLADVLGLGNLATDDRFATPADRERHGTQLASLLEPVFLRRSAAEWFAALDARGVPCEISKESWGTEWFDDPDVLANGWVTDYRHDVWGRMEQPGKLFDFSDTPSRIFGPPPVVGAHTRQVLADLGYDDARVAALKEAGIVGW